MVPGEYILLTRHPVGQSLVAYKLVWDVLFKFCSSGVGWESQGFPESFFLSVAIPQVPQKDMSGSAKETSRMELGVVEGEIGENWMVSLWDQLL